MVINEAYFNLSILDVMNTQAIRSNAKDRNRLIRALKTDSRQAQAVLSVDKGMVAKLKDRILKLMDQSSSAKVEDFNDWTDTEIYHFVLNKIDVLKTIVTSELEHEDRLLINRRLANIRHAVVALIRKMTA